jgi:hypothetical protein
VAKRPIDTAAVRARAEDAARYVDLRDQGIGLSVAERRAILSFFREVPNLCRDLDSARADVATLRKALEFYADQFPLHIGEVARAALKETDR